MQPVPYIRCARSHRIGFFIGPRGLCFSSHCRIYTYWAPLHAGSSTVGTAHARLSRAAEATRAPQYRPCSCALLTARRGCRGGPLGTTRKRRSSPGPVLLWSVILAPAALHFFLSYRIYVSGAVARRGLGPSSAASRRDLRLGAARLHAQGVTRRGSLIQSLRVTEPRALSADTILSVRGCLFHVTTSHVSYTPGAAAPSAPDPRGLTRLSPRILPWPPEGSPRGQTEGTARGFRSIPLQGFVS